MLCASCSQLVPDDAAFCLRCGLPLSADVAPPRQSYVGREFGSGRYAVERTLGEGGMGTVLEALDRRLNRKVALKILNPELVAHPTARRRMAQEAQALARIEHPNVVRVFDVFDEGQLLVLVLELVTGGDLRQKVHSGGIGVDDAVRLMDGALAGLQAIHDAGLVHRDFKPGNVLLAADGTPKVTDLGVARDSRAGQRTALGASLGTPEYMSPEQVQGGEVDARSDVYAAGVVLFELLAGRRPFDGVSEFDLAHAHVHKEPKLELLAGKPERLVSVVNSALAKALEKRFASARAMGNALKWANDGTSPAFAPQTAVPSPPPARPPIAVQQPEFARNDPWRAPQSGSAEACEFSGLAANPSKWSISFDGRMARWQTFICQAGALLLALVAAFAVAVVLGAKWAVGASGGNSATSEILTFLIALLWFIYTLSVSVRRAHDCDWTGWFVLLLFIPYVGVIFGLMLTFNAGTTGPNRFGPDPLAKC